MHVYFSEYYTSGLKQDVLYYWYELMSKYIYINAHENRVAGRFGFVSRLLLRNLSRVGQEISRIVKFKKKKMRDSNDSVTSFNVEGTEFLVPHINIYILTLANLSCNCQFNNFARPL